MSVTDYSERIEVLGGLSPSLNLPTVRAWIERVAAQPGMIAIDD